MWSAVADVMFTHSAGTSTAWAGHALTATRRVRIFDPANKWWYTKRYFFPSISQRRACDCDVMWRDLSIEAIATFVLFSTGFILGPLAHITKINYIYDYRNKYNVQHNYSRRILMIRQDNNCFVNSCVGRYIYFYNFDTHNGMDSNNFNLYLSWWWYERWC
jgi:hypothetical protein